MTNSLLNYIRENSKNWEVIGQNLSDGELVLIKSESTIHVEEVIALIKKYLDLSEFSIVSDDIPGIIYFKKEGSNHHQVYWDFLRNEQFLVVRVQM